MNRLAKLRHLSSSDRWILMQAGLLLCGARVGLWLLPFQRLQQLLARDVVGVGSEQTLIKTVWAVNVTSPYVPGSTCLPRALVTQLMLTRQGCSSTLRIGVTRNEQGKVEAHAWVESQGRVIINGLPDMDRFSPIALESHS